MNRIVFFSLFAVICFQFSIYNSNSRSYPTFFQAWWRQSHVIVSAYLFCVNKSSNIRKTTKTNQCRRVPDLWRPGSVKIKRCYIKNGRLIPKAKRRKEIRQSWNCTCFISFPLFAVGISLPFFCILFCVPRLPHMQWDGEKM